MIQLNVIGSEQEKYKQIAVIVRLEWAKAMMFDRNADFHGT